jgi:hypothetical protein
MMPRTTCTTILSLLAFYNSYNNCYQTHAFIVPSSVSPTAFSCTSSVCSTNARQQLQHQQHHQHQHQQQTTELYVSTKGEEEVATNAAESPPEASPSKEASSPTVSVKTTGPNPQISYTKLLRLKDRMWVREALEDLTASEFACNIARSSPDEDTSSGSGTGTNDDGKNKKKEKKKKSAVDFENLLIKLEKRIEDMCIRSTYGDNEARIVSYPMEQSISSDAFPKPDDECWSLMENYGMGSVTYTDDQRSALVLRLLASKQEIIKAMEGTQSKSQPNNGQNSLAANDLEQIREKLQTPDVIVADEDNKIKTNGGDGVAGPTVYVRDDGTVDWDGALQDRAALKEFGTSVWARINGQDPDFIDEDAVNAASSGESHKNQVTVKIVETEAIKDKKETLDLLKSELERMEKEHTALLNSAVSAGSAVANVNLALVEPELRSKIRASDNELEKKRDEVSFETLLYELERIYTYLDGELGNTATKGYIPLQDRLNVAEFGLLESQIGSMKNQIESGGIVDSDVLAVVMEQMIDLKRRLGIDYYVTGLTLDQEKIKIWLNELVENSKEGLAFYGKGCQLFFNDCVFSTSLIGKALVGYTLKPREVRTLRRTFKDVITFIPVVIILIIPLTPIGHVLIFGAIQRFYPDFFPTCFTERRQNLLSLYESTEFSEFTIEENWQEKSIRILEAAGFVIVDNTKKLFSQLGDNTSTSPSTSKDGEEDAKMNKSQ